MVMDVERGNVLIVDDAVSMGRMRDALFAGGVHYVGIDAEWPPNRGSGERSSGGLKKSGQIQGRDGENIGNSSGQIQGNSGQNIGNSSGRIQGNSGQNIVSLVQIATDSHVFLVDMYACATIQKDETEDSGGEQKLCDALGGILRRLLDSSETIVLGYGIAHDLSQSHTLDPAHSKP